MRLSVATRAKIALTTAIAIAAAYYATADPPRAFYILHRHADAIRAVLADELPETADPRRASILWVDGVGARALRGAPSPPWQRISRLDGVMANQSLMDYCSPSSNGDIFRDVIDDETTMLDAIAWDDDEGGNVTTAR